MIAMQNLMKLSSRKRHKRRTLTSSILQIDPGRLHAIVSQDINELVSERGDVLSDLHDVILGDPGLVPGALLGGHVATD